MTATLAGTGPGAAGTQPGTNARPIRLSKATASSAPAETTGCAGPGASPATKLCSGPGTHPAGAEKAALVHRAKTVTSDIAGKTPVKKRAGHRGGAGRPAFRRPGRHRATRPGGRGPTPKPLPAQASAGGDDDGTRSHTGVGSQELSQEEATPGRGHEIAEPR